jgi:hypothetical protein
VLEIAARAAWTCALVALAEIAAVDFCLKVSEKLPVESASVHESI